MKTKIITIKSINSKETHAVRHPVLRAGRPIEDCFFNGDDDPTTFHLGLFEGEIIVGVASFMQNKNKLFEDFNQFQLRGMAILKEKQGQGYGALLLKEGESLIIAKNSSRIWFNAREVATSFYKKKGYKSIGASFEIPKVGIHYIMTKKVN